MYDYYEEKFARLNRETLEFRNRQVDRFNYSTRSNYNTLDPYRTGHGYYNPDTATENNSSGWYDGRGQYHSK
jgi:hypothetical protein